METASQTVVTPDELSERFQDIQVATQTGARPKQMMQRHVEEKRSVVYPTDLAPNRSRKTEESPRSNILSLSSQRQRPSESQNRLITGKAIFPLNFEK